MDYSKYLRDRQKTVYTQQKTKPNNKLEIKLKHTHTPVLLNGDESIIWPEGEEEKKSKRWWGYIFTK